MIDRKPPAPLRVTKTINPQYVEIPIDRIDRDEKYMQDKDTSTSEAMIEQNRRIAELAERLNSCSVGDAPRIIEPVVLIEVGERTRLSARRYLVTGYTTIMACQRARRSIVPAWIYAVETTDEGHLVNLENISRKDASNNG